MGAAELIYQLRSGKNQSGIQRGTVMKHFNAVGWSDFANHLAGSDRQEMQGHRGARRKHCVQTPALWQKFADAAVVEARYQPAPEKVRFVKAVFALAGLATKRQEMGRNSVALRQLLSAAHGRNTLGSAANQTAAL